MTAACLPRTAAIPQDVEIALCRLDDDRDVALAAAARWLSPEEAARADGFRLQRDRDRYIRGRGFLRLSLADRLGRDPGRLALSTERHGKPCLPESGLAFNLSHSGHLAALAMSTAHEVGIDIELLDSGSACGSDFSSLVRACFTPEEAAAIAAAPAPQVTFLRFWTAKEARMKLTGEGLALDPRAIALAHDNGVPLAYLVPDRPAASLHTLEIKGAVGTLALGHRGQPCYATH